METKSKQNFWRQNWKIVSTAAGILIIFLILFFVPFATVPVKAIETYYTTEIQSQPVTETVMQQQTYTEPVTKEEILFRDYLVPVQWGQYVAIPCSINLRDKINPWVNGNFVVFDQMGVRFLILDTYNFMLYQKPFTPTPIYESRSNAGSFSFSPNQNQYYFVFDNFGYNFLRYFQLNATLTWTESITKYRDVPVTQVVYKQVPIQVERQREVIKNEKRSLFQLLTG